MGTFDNYKIIPQVRINNLTAFCSRHVFQKGVCLPIRNAVKTLTKHYRRAGQSSNCQFLK